MAYKAKIRVTLRKSILDTQGKTVLHALGQLGYVSVENVRIGKYIEMDVREADRDRALSQVKEACEKLLSNPVMEDYTVELESLTEVG